MRWRSVWLTACSAALALALAGCGGSEGETETEVAGPTIERATAERLAALSDEVGRSLDAGDACAALDAATRLREGVTAAINDGKVPTVYLEDLSGLTNEIEAQIPECAGPAPTPPEDEGQEDEDDDDGAKKGRKREKKDRGPEKPVSTESEPAETDTEATTTETDTTTTTTTMTTETTGTTTGPEG
jgi:hypothetical protein